MQNICKFNFNRSSDLVCDNFIFEAEQKELASTHALRCMLGLVAEGEGTLCCGMQHHALYAGALFFLPEGEAFSIRNEAGLKYYYIHFSGRRAAELAMRFEIAPAHCVFVGHEALIGFWQSCQHMAQEGNIDLLCEAVLLYSLSQLEAPVKAPGDVVAQMIAITQEEFSSPALSVSALSERLGYDAKYLSSLFKKKKGVGYTQYLRELRVRHAIFLMEQGVVSVKNVALLSGFGDALYFSKVFTKATGTSPKHYIAAVAARRE